jgi:hypothetical protein
MVESQVLAEAEERWRIAERRRIASESTGQEETPPEGEGRPADGMGAAAASDSGGDQGHGVAGEEPPSASLAELSRVLPGGPSAEAECGQVVGTSLPTEADSEGTAEIRGELQQRGAGLSAGGSVHHGANFAPTGAGHVGGIVFNSAPTGAEHVPTTGVPSGNGHFNYDRSPGHSDIGGDGVETMPGKVPDGAANNPPPATEATDKGVTSVRPQSKRTRKRGVAKQ